MAQREIADHDASADGLTASASSDPPEDGFAEQITAEFTSRRRTSGMAARWIPTRRWLES